MPQILHHTANEFPQRELAVINLPMKGVNGLDGSVILEKWCKC